MCPSTQTNDTVKTARAMLFGIRDKYDTIRWAAEDVKLRTMQAAEDRLSAAMAEADRKWQIAFAASQGRLQKAIDSADSAWELTANAVSFNLEAVLDAMEAEWEVAVDAAVAQHGQALEVIEEQWEEDADSALIDQTAAHIAAERKFEGSVGQMRDAFYSARDYYLALLRGEPAQTV